MAKLRSQEDEGAVASYLLGDGITYEEDDMGQGLELS